MSGKSNSAPQTRNEIEQYVKRTRKKSNNTVANRASVYPSHASTNHSYGSAIRMLIPMPGNAGVGGAHISALLLGHGLRDEFGWEVTFALQPGTPTANFFSNYDTEILESPKKVLRPLKNDRSRLRRVCRFIALFADALRIIRKVRPNYITLNIKKGFLSWALAAKITGVPVIWYVRAIRKKGWDNWLRIRLSDKIIFASEAVRSVYSIDKLPPNRTIRNGVRPGFFLASLGSVRSEFAVSDSQLLIVFIGNMVPRKRPVWAAEAVCRAIKAGIDLRFLMIGERRDCLIVSQVQRTFDRYGESERLNIAGYRDDVANVMEAADILVLTSHQAGEAFPRVIIEAMAKELCVVATNVAGVAEAVTDRKTGFLVSPEDQDGFTSVLVELGKNPKLRCMIASNAKEEAEKRFNQKLVVKQFESFIVN